MDTAEDIVPKLEKFDRSSVVNELFRTKVSALRMPRDPESFHAATSLATKAVQ